MGRQAQEGERPRQLAGGIRGATLVLQDEQPLRWVGLAGATRAVSAYWPREMASVTTRMRSPKALPRPSSSLTRPPRSWWLRPET